MEISAKELGKLLDGTVEGDLDVLVNRPSKIEEGGQGSITFLGNPKYEQFAYTSTASIIIVSRDFKPSRPLHPTLIRVDDVYSAIATLLEQFGNRQNGVEYEVSEKASVHQSAVIERQVAIGDFSFIARNARIGQGTVLHPQVFVGESVVIGKNCTLYPGVKIYHHCVLGDHCVIHSNVVIGADGFGFAPQTDGTFKKVAQIGNVVIENDVEIGSGTTIDRATIGSTFIRKGVKIDNLVQVGHNVEIGENTVIAAQTGIAGSTKIGKNCMIGGQVGFSGHLKIADGTLVQAQSGIAASVDTPNSSLFGSPAINYNDFIKSYAVFKKLPELYRKIYHIEQRISKKEDE